MSKGKSGIELNRIAAIEAGDRTYQGGPCKHGHSAIRYTGSKACVECERVNGAARKAAIADSERERKKAWKRNNRERVLREKRDYRLRHLAAVREKQREYVRNDPNGLIALRAEFAKAESHLRKAERRRVREETAEDRRERERVKARQRYRDMQIFETADQASERRAKDRARWYKQMELDPEGTRLKGRMARSLRRARMRGVDHDATTKQITELLKWQNGCCAYCGESENLHLDHKTPISRQGKHTINNLQWLCAYHNLNKRTSTDEEYRAANNIPLCTIWDAL